MAIYKGIMRADPHGGYSVEVLGVKVNGQGESIAEAVDNASEILREVVQDLRMSGEDVPAPKEPALDDLEAGTLVVFQAVLEAA